jgi:hypothetical protein
MHHLFPFPSLTTCRVSLASYWSIMVSCIIAFDHIAQKRTESWSEPIELFEKSSTSMK